MPSTQNPMVPITPLKPAPVGDRSALYVALARINAGGSTDLHGGWQAGAATLLAGATQAALARVILLSDGNAKVGPTTDNGTVAALCAEAAANGATTSTYGLGRSFNEELMVEAARNATGESVGVAARLGRGGARVHPFGRRSIQARTRAVHNRCRPNPEAARASPCYPRKTPRHC